MDPKKQNLTPELKQIYDRVMNTQVKNPPASPNQAPITTAPTAPPAQTPPQGAVPVSPTPQTPPQPVQTPAQTPFPPPPTTPLATGEQNIQNTDPFLSSVPPRPVADTKPFVFANNKVSSPADKSATQTVAKSGKKLSGKIIGLLIAVFVVVWGLFWAKFFGLL